MIIEELDVFKLAHQLALTVYQRTERFPDTEKFGLVSQMRRAAASIPSNLIEGSHRIGSNELKHFVSIARGSCGELKYQLALSRDLGYIDSTACGELLAGFDRVAMMLTRLYASLGNKENGNE